MSRARPAYRPAALGEAILLAVVSGVPVQATISRDPAVERGVLAAAPRGDRPAWDQPSTDDPGRLIVTFRAGTTLSARASLAVRTGARRIAEAPGVRAETLQVPAARSAATVAALRADPNVARVSVDHRRYREADPTGEPLWHELWGLDNTGQDILQGKPGSGGTVDADIDGLQALGITTGDPSVVVAMIDDGVDFSHPDLAARAWTNPGESGGGKETNGIDDDGNGYIDDVHGWDFCHDDNTVHDFDDDFHGTHVAGTIAASLDGEGVVGVAPSVSIMALKFLGDDPACGWDDQAIAAIAYAKSFGVHIANASWGAPGRPIDAPELHDAIANSGMLFVAAAGNDSIDNDSETEPTLPASFDLPNIVSVAAIDNSGGLASFSDYGATTVDIAAPGKAILSSLPADSEDPQGWGWLDGTSMATPHVTGTAALVASISPTLAADPVAMKAHLLASGKPDAATDGLTLTGKIIDADRALDLVPPVAGAPSSFGFVVGSVASSTSVDVKVGWPAGTDDRTGIVAYGLQSRAGTGAWLTARGSTPDRSTLRTLRPGTTYGFRVRAQDGAGNWSPYATSQLRPSLYQESSSGARFAGSWSRSRTSSASGGATRFATRAGASVTFRFTGRGFALIAPKGPTRGSAKLYVDGALVSTVNLFRAGSQARVVVAARAWSGSGAHTVKLVVLGTKHHPRFDVDAFAVLR